MSVWIDSTVLHAFIQEFVRSNTILVAW